MKNNYQLLIYYIIFLVVFALIGCQSEVQVKQYEGQAKGDIPAILTGQPHVGAGLAPARLIEQPQEITYNDTRPVKQDETKVTFKISYDIWRIKSPQPPLSKVVMKSGDLKTQAFPATTITKIDVKIIGLGIPNPESPIPNPIDISGTPGVFNNINLNLNVPIGKKRIIIVKGLDATQTPIAGAELKAVFDVPAGGVVDVNWNTTPTASVYEDMLTRNTTRSKLSLSAIDITAMKNFINTIPIAHKSLVNVQKVTDTILTLNETEPLTGNLAQLPTDGVTNVDYRYTTIVTIKLKDMSGNNFSGIQVLMNDPASSNTISDINGQVINTIPPGTWRGQIKLSGNVIEEDNIVVGADGSVNLGTLAGDNILDWWNTNWNYKKAISLTNTGANLTDYQVKVSIDNSDNNFWNNVKSDGVDIRFIDSDNLTQLNNYWIESFDNVGKTANLWIKMPNIPNGAKTIYLYYANTGATTTASFDNTMQKILDTNANGCVGLWHFDGNANDSSGNGNNGTVTGATWVGTDGGQFDGLSTVKFATGNSLSFDGVNDYVITQNSIPVSGSFTVAFWAKPYTPTIVNAYWFANYNAGNGFGIMSNPDGWSTFRRWTSGSYYDCLWTLTAGMKDVWGFFVAVNDVSSTARVYYNGEIIAGPSASNNMTLSSEFLYIGSWIGGGYNGCLILDEVAIYNRALSADEIKAHYERRKYTLTPPSLNLGVGISR